MGNPLESVPIPEIIHTLGDVISIASNPEEFMGKIVYELQNDNHEKRRKRMEKVSNETWKRKAEEISDVIMSILK